MRENIIEQLRFCASRFSCEGCVGKCATSSNEPRTAFVLNNAADAIEELLTVTRLLETSVNLQASIIRHMETVMKANGLPTPPKEVD